MAQIPEQSALSSSDSPEQLQESLGRLSKKAGVLATIVLDRSSGAILSTTGNIASSNGLSSSSALGTSAESSEEPIGTSGEQQGIRDLASMAWNFINAAGGMIQTLDAEDEMKLLRLRTKKYELVIVPDAKYLLIVVHETPTI